MTSTQTDLKSVVHQLAEMAVALEAQVTAPKPVDPKYNVTSEFFEAPKSTITPLLKAYRDAEEALAAAKLVMADAEQAIKDLMDGAEVLVVEETKQYVVESRVTVAQRFDTATFKKENPEVAAQYQVPRYSRSFRVL